MNIIADQRTSKRFKLRNKAFTKLSDNSNPYHVAIIVDMSRGGMAFNYLGTEPICSSLSKLDILYEDGLCLNDIPVKIVSDILVERKKIPTRRCGIQFTSLTQTQMGRIESFIENYEEINV